VVVVVCVIIGALVLFVLVAVVLRRRSAAPKRPPTSEFSNPTFDDSAALPGALLAPWDEDTYAMHIEDQPQGGVAVPQMAEAISGGVYIEVEESGEAEA